MSASANGAGPLSASDAERLASARLGAGERHQLNLLAHSLRTLQAIAGRRHGPPPDSGAIVAWAQQQPLLAEDPHFRAAFCRQLLSSADLLSQIAGAPLAAVTTAADHEPTRPERPAATPSAESVSPLGLELEHLIIWCEQRRETPAQSR